MNSMIEPSYGTEREKGEFALGYLQAMDLMIAHWPEDRKCRCDPVMSGGTKPPCNAGPRTST